MEKPYQHRQQRGNPSSSSYSGSEPAKNTKSSHFNWRANASEWRTRRKDCSNESTQKHLTFKSQRGETEDQPKLQSLPTASGSLTGTCAFMCPESERTQRERLRDLAVFERLHGNPGKSSPSLAVKKFCRTISTIHLETSDVRPLSVLEETLSYLLNLVDSTNHPFEVVHDFIFDRTRSIRQDLSMQNIVNDKAIYMYEKMVNFHVVSHLKLRRCGSSPNISSMLHLNMEQLTKCLASLYNLYDANRNSSTIFGNEAEFRSLYVLLHLDSGSQPTGESLSLWLRHVPRPIIASKEMHFARTVLRYFRIGNYKSFFSTIGAKASYRQYCIIEPHINEVRALCLSCVNNAGYKLHPYPLLHLSRILMMKESDLESFCNACGLKTCTDEAGNKLLPTKQITIDCPKGELQSYIFLGLEQFEM